MIIKGKRQKGIPIIINESKSLRLEKIPFNEKTFYESYIQELVQGYKQKKLKNNWNIMINLN